MKIWSVSKQGIILLCLVFPLLALAAWQEPGAAPPGSNAGGPLNVSTARQVKSGGLSIGGILWGLDKLWVTPSGAPPEGDNALLSIFTSGDIGATSVRSTTYCDALGNN